MVKAAAFLAVINRALACDEASVPNGSVAHQAMASTTRQLGLRKLVYFRQRAGREGAAKVP